MANEEQARYWAEDAGPRWVDDEQGYDVMLEPFGAAVLSALDLRPGERVLDVGCGFGTTTLAVAREVGPDGHVDGVDISAAMVARAQDRATLAGTAHVRFDCADAQTAALDGPYDAVVSRFGVMFFDDPAAAFANIGQAVRRSGRLAFICWRTPAENPWFTIPNGIIMAALPEPPPPPESTAPGPFAFADRSRVVSLLAAAGWAEVSVEPFDSVARVGGARGVEGALEHARTTLAGRLLVAQAPADRVDAVFAEVRAALVPHEQDGLMSLPAAAWVVTARRP